MSNEEKLEFYLHGFRDGEYLQWQNVLGLLENIRGWHYVSGATMQEKQSIFVQFHVHYMMNWLLRHPEKLDWMS